MHRFTYKHMHMEPSLITISAAFAMLDGKPAMTDRFQHRGWRLVVPSRSLTHAGIVFISGHYLLLRLASCIALALDLEATRRNVRDEDASWQRR